jgi:hypothetical protein
MTSDAGESGLLLGPGWVRRRWTLSRDRQTVAARWWFDVTARDGEIGVSMQPLPSADDSDCKGTHAATPPALRAELGIEQEETVDQDNWRERVWIQR